MTITDLEEMIKFIGEVRQNLEDPNDAKTLRECAKRLEMFLSELKDSVNINDLLWNAKKLLRLYDKHPNDIPGI